MLFTGPPCETMTQVITVQKRLTMSSRTATNIDVLPATIWFIRESVALGSLAYHRRPNTAPDMLSRVVGGEGGVSDPCRWRRGSGRSAPSFLAFRPAVAANDAYNSLRRGDRRLLSPPDPASTTQHSQLVFQGKGTRQARRET